jgi:geranylgeranyl transferase type-2 subunit alpha
MCTFDPDIAKKTMAPNLSQADRLAYIAGEREFILDLLEDAKDCKWVYQALIECTLVAAKVAGSLSLEAKRQIQNWLVELRRLDPLRKGRWDNLEESLQ